MKSPPRLSVRRSRSLRDLRWCARLMASSEPWLTLRRGYADSLALLKDPLREVFLARLDGDPAGFIVLVMVGALRGYVQAVAVRPDLRGGGVGGALIRFAERRVFARTPNLFLCVSSFNPRAQAFYRRLGYRLVGKLPDYVVRGRSELLLRKTVGPLSGFRKPRSAAA